MAPKTILVVDDDPGIVKLVETMLQRDGYDVLVAYNGREALRIHAANQIQSNTTKEWYFVLAQAETKRT